MYKELSPKVRFPDLEKEILDFWEKNRIFERSVEERDPNRRFVFYEGPPTANGRPGIHHVLSRTMKDFVCRLKTMQGYRVERKAGWDTHGLPVEIEIEKELGIRTKSEIIKFGVAEFNRRCKESVFRYKQEWDELTRRIGFWLDLEHPYVTYTNEYIETVWWILNQFWKAGLMYEGHKILPYCPRCETPLSSHEVSQGYEEVEDPSVFVRMRLVDQPGVSFLVWTTTPWTLISNVALAVHPDVKYVRVHRDDEDLILAEARLGVLDGDYEIVEEYEGRQLERMRYEPLYTYVKPDKDAYYVVLGDFVTTEEGTGIVHIAPAFGEDDYEVGQKYGLPVLQPVNESGKFTEEVTPWAGKFVKDADPEIIEDLKSRGLLFRAEKYRHSYPHCWRCKSPLLYYARKSWYIRTTAYKDKLVENNKKIAWYPKEVGEGRFGEWLENNVDWALSRDRFWGTPLNIWVCDKCGHQESVGSLAELKAKSGLKEDIDLHKPYIDEVTWKCEKCGGTMVRTPEVIDVWFDSGSMPYAQWHYPFENKEKFEVNFPADFISEAVDQTRGWFYSLLAISTFISGEPAYKTVLCLELVLDKRGQKMAKSRGNTVDPFEHLNREGADALRWYFMTVSPPWVPTRFDPEGVTEAMRKYLNTLVNVYSFFALYANIDGFQYTGPSVPVEERSELDRWILSAFNRLVARVNRATERYDVTRAARDIGDFVLEDLSNWYVRRSRRRFWKSGLEQDKQSAYETLYEVLLNLAKLTAPFTPFIAEVIYRNLTADQKDACDSVHLCTYPDPSAEAFQYIDEALLRQMEIARDVVDLGRSLRAEAGIRVRVPLPRLLLLAKDERFRDAVRAVEQLILDELNVKRLELVDDPKKLLTVTAKPVFRSLGPKFGKDVNAVAEAIRQLTPEQIEEIQRNGQATVETSIGPVSIAAEDIEVHQEQLPGLVAGFHKDLTAALDTNLTPELIAEGLAREFVNRVQNMRKEAGYNVADRIRVYYRAPEEVAQAIGKLADYVRNETLAVELIPDKVDGDYTKEWKVGDYKVEIGVQRVTEDASES
ncbi:MAG: isoleucine--tRNA ligase [Calditrichaeota bacterium]|nr:isoleucine--tRNA ligase [Calditrichota bacterium]